MYTYLLQYFINIYIAEYLILYVVLLDFFTVDVNFVTSDNDNYNLLYWFYNVFTVAMGYL